MTVTRSGEDAVKGRGVFDEIITEAQVVIRQETDVVVASQQGRALAACLGMSASSQTAVTIAIAEIARNIVWYAWQGQIILQAVRRGDRQGIVVRATDNGPGISDVGRAMQDGYSTGRGLGLGLPGARRLMDEFEIVSEVGKGTLVTMKKWKA